MQDYNEELLKHILENQAKQDEKLAYILNNQNTKLDSVLQKIKKNKISKIWAFLRKVFFILLFLGFILAFFHIMFAPFSESVKSAKINYNHIAQIDLTSEISANGLTNAKNIIESLEAAVKNDKARYIVLNINSPGGSPVQSALIYDAIMRLKSDKKPIYAIISDLGASGAYYVASAASKIYAHKSSLVGSIGVISINFGVKDLFQTLGIEPRITTAGKNKDFLSQFSDLNLEQQAYWQNILDETHADFINDVKLARQNKFLIANEAELFSGLIFTGSKSKQLGLIDELGSLYSVQSSLDLPLVNYTYEPNVWDNFAILSSKFINNLFTSSSSVKLN